MSTNITITSILPGSVGNAYTISSATAALVASGATLSGGADYPASPAPALDVGRRTFDVAADKWQKGKTNPLTAFQEVADSELGFVYVTRAGVFTFHNQDWWFQRVTASPVVVDSSHVHLEGDISDEMIFNRIVVSYTPRYSLAPGVIAQSQSVIEVPAAQATSAPQGASNASTGSVPIDRYNPATALWVPGTKTVTLNCTDPATGQQMAWQSITLPLVPYTDFTANERADGAGIDYTPSPSARQNIFVSVATKANAIEVTFANTAIGPLYVTMLKVRGVGLVSYQQQQSIAEDLHSQIDLGYGKRELPITIPLPSGQKYADAVANYYLSRYKLPQYRVTKLVCDPVRSVGGVPLISVEIGDVIQISDVQAGLSAAKYLVTGITTSFDKDKKLSLEFSVRDLDLTPYYIVGDATYGRLGYYPFKPL